MAKYILCPRCELNYIDEEKQEYCDVCIKEMQGAKTFTDDLEAQEEAEMETEICPCCGENYMRYGEKMCDECKKKTQYEDEEAEDPDQDDGAWRTYLDDDSEDLELGGMPEGEFAGEFEEEEEEEEEEELVDEDDFEYVSVDDYNPDDDEDDEDEDFFDDDEAPTPRSGSKKRAKDDDEDF